MYKGKTSWHLTCPRHVRYNPYRGGEAAIRGGCVCCGAIWRVARQIKILEEAKIAAENAIAFTREKDIIK